LRREFGLDVARDQSRAVAAAPRLHLGRRERQSFRPDKDYTDHSVSGFRFDGKLVRCRFFKDVLVELSNQLRVCDQAAFDKAAVELRGTKRPYFSRNAGDLKFAQQLTGHGLFVETNLNANLIIGICRQLLVKLGRDPDRFEVV